MLKLLSSSKICTSGALVAHLYSGISNLSYRKEIKGACMAVAGILQSETGMLRAYARTHHNRRSLCWLSRLDCSQSTGEPIVKDTL
ncbi:hypothetical protein LENED_004419 [Lentinula edodes]|uniref:Uncharacterized protein n=1 Tax=Lentinula edodes TaxID=5353 RepID=A0A1Q3E685_LENED|nr:hypothetical protein LENED_004419 [Lentinula edodes]